MADGSRAISAAVLSVFPHALRRYCYFHVIQAVEREFQKLQLSTAQKSVIKNDIHELANLGCASHFEIVGEDLVQKWKNTGNEEMIKFADYFKKEYINDKKNYVLCFSTNIDQQNLTRILNNLVAPLQNGLSIFGSNTQLYAKIIVSTKIVSPYLSTIQDFQDYINNITIKETVV